MPGAFFHSEVIPTGSPIAQRRQARHAWFQTVHKTLEAADLVFIDPDNGLEPDGYSHGSAKAGKSIALAELRALARPGRCQIVYHHHTRRKGGHHGEIEHWAGRLREAGFLRVDALRAKPYSPRVFFLLDAPADVRAGAKQVAADWQGLITWHPGGVMGRQDAVAGGPSAPALLERMEETPAKPPETRELRASGAKRSGRSKGATTTQVGYVNRNGQEVIRPTGNAGTDHGQYVYVLRCRGCGHEYGANGSDIFQRRCPNHGGGAPGLAF